MSLPEPVPGLVIRYSYLWTHEADAGREGGIKDRPCAVLLSTIDRRGRRVAIALPVTHSPPSDLTLAVEIPLHIKVRLGLDDANSWIILSEANRFIWPGPDLRSVGGDGQNFTYGLLPDRLFEIVRKKWLAAYDRGKVRQVQRSE